LILTIEQVYKLHLSGSMLKVGNQLMPAYTCTIVVYDDYIHPLVEVWLIGAMIFTWYGSNILCKMFLVFLTHLNE
jgi:hypothetical protein